MPLSMDVILVQTVINYITDNPPGPNFDRLELQQNIVDQTRLAIDAQNALLSKTTKMKVPDRLANAQIAQIIQMVEPVACISCERDPGDDGTEFDLLGVYESDGPNAGVYNTSDRALDKLIATYNWTAVKRDMDEVKSILRRALPRRQRCMDRDLIAVNNGIFNYKTKTLQPFTPDLIFLSKSRVNYNPNARNVVIHNPDDHTDWDVESWMSELSDDPEIVELLWQIQGAIIRPFVRWNKSAWLYSMSGNSGKGTLCELMRNLCGRKNYASIPLSDFAKDFQLEPLIRANAIIVDENDVGVYLDKVANLKAVITNDVILINRKYKTPITYQFFGFVVQCLNEYPKVRDRTNSFYRRQIFIPFDKCYTGLERRYIKDDYLSRPEVLEYVLFKVLNMNYYELSEPDSCRLMLEDVKESNDPVRQFVTDMLPQCVWDLLPFTFLYDLYKAWLPKVNPGGSPLSSQAFRRELLAAIQDSPDWKCEVKNKVVSSKNRMDKPEPLIAKYSLTEWMNPNYKGPDVNLVCRPALSSAYRGLERKAPVVTSVTFPLPQAFPLPPTGTTGQSC